jgi:chromosome segregation ATPase
MKFPLVTRKRLESAELRIHLLETAVAKCAEEYESHEASLMHCYEVQQAQKAEIERKNEALGAARAECIQKAEEIRFLGGRAQKLEASEAEVSRLTAEFEKLTADYNALGSKVPAFRPKAVRWSGPDGARAQIEKALAEQREQNTGTAAIRQPKAKKKN